MVNRKKIANNLINNSDDYVLRFWFKEDPYKIVYSIHTSFLNQATRELLAYIIKKKIGLITDKRKYAYCCPICKQFSFLDLCPICNSRIEQGKLTEEEFNRLTRYDDIPKLILKNDPVYTSKFIEALNQGFFILLYRGE